MRCKGWQAKACVRMSRLRGPSKHYEHTSTTCIHCDKHTCTLWRAYAGMFVMLVAPGPAIGGALASTIGSFWFLFAGFLIPRPTMPPWWQWLFYTSPMSWAVEACFVSQLGDKVRLRFLQLDALWFVLLDWLQLCGHADGPCKRWSSFMIDAPSSSHGASASLQRHLSWLAHHWWQAGISC